MKKSKEEQNNKNIELEKDINNLKNQLNEGKINYEKLLIELDSTSKLSIDLKKKVDFLEDENNILKKNCVELSQNLSKINYNKNDKTDIENELEYKNDIIKYLEGLLKKMNINPKLLSEEKYKKESFKNKKNNIIYNKLNNIYNNPNLISSKKDNCLIYKSSNNILDKYLDNDNSLENFSNINNSNNSNNNSKDFQKEKKTYTSRPVNISELVTINYANGKLNSNKNIYNKPKSCEKKIKNDNGKIIQLNQNNNDKINSNSNEENNTIMIQENENKNYFSFYNWGQNNNNPNLVEYKKIYNSNFNSPETIKKEIDDLDKEILELQTRLKTLLDES